MKLADVAYAVRKLAPDHGMEIAHADGEPVVRVPSNDRALFYVRRRGGKRILTGVVKEDVMLGGDALAMVNAVDAELARLASEETRVS